MDHERRVLGVTSLGNSREAIHGSHASRAGLDSLVDAFFRMRPQR